MRKPTPSREIGFLIKDVGRLIGVYADQEVRRFGMTRAQWAVLSRLERFEGLKQAELAEMLDLQPITLTRLIDRLCDSGMIERRADPNDRRAKRLFLTPAAKPLMDRLDVLGDELMATVLEGIEPAETEQVVRHLGSVRENLRRALSNRAEAENRKNHG
jgi:MarR family transcriptional regulator for hemolysin